MSGGRKARGWAQKGENLPWLQVLNPNQDFSWYLCYTITHDKEGTVLYQQNQAVQKMMEWLEGQLCARHHPAGLCGPQAAHAGSAGPAPRPGEDIGHCGEIRVLLPGGYDPGVQGGIWVHPGRVPQESPAYPIIYGQRRVPPLAVQNLISRRQPDE